MKREIDIVDIIFYSAFIAILTAVIILVLSL